MINNRWFQLCASLVAMIMIANLQYAWTLFVTSIQKGTGWELSDIQWAFSLFIFCQTWVQPLDGWLIDRLGPRMFVAIAGVLCGAGWAGMGFATSVPAFYGLYVTAGVGAALVYSGCIGSALKWFKQRRGLAVGIMAAGFGAGTALFIPTIDHWIRAYGYQKAFLWSGLFQGAMILAVAPFLRHPPQEPAATAPTAPTAPAATRPAVADVGRRQFTTIEMLRSSRFYVLYLSFVLIATGGLLVTAHAGPIAASWGLSQDALKLAVWFSPIANGASRIFWGWVSDRAGRELTMTVAFVLQAVSLLLVLGLGPTSGTWFIVTLVLTYFTWGEIFALFPSTVGDYFGAKHATSNYSVLYTAKGVGAMILAGGPAAMLFKRFGTWSPVFYASAAMALVAAVMILGLRRRAAR
jgi:MFS transporter, OFA family, oxalate/formate antiporter